jgi:hypothetical protein
MYLSLSDDAGHSDMSKFEWASNMHRDTLASHVGHHDMYARFLCFHRYVVSFAMLCVLFYIFPILGYRLLLLLRMIRLAELDINCLR